MKRFSMILALAAAAAASPAYAQVEGSRLTKYADQSSASEVMEIWVGCLAQLEAPWAKSVLESVPTSQQEVSIHKAREPNNENDRCLEDSRVKMYGRELRFTPTAMRGELARYFALRAIEREGSKPRPGAAMAWLNNALATLSTGQGYDRSVLVGNQFASCLVDEHWAESHALVKTKPGSKQEKAAMAALAPFFSACMTQGAKIALTVPILRLQVAEALYHSLTYVPPPQPAAGSASERGLKLEAAE